MTAVVRTMETIEDSVATMDRKVEVVAERMPQRLGTYDILKRTVIFPSARIKRHSVTVVGYGILGYGITVFHYRTLNCYNFEYIRD